MKQENTQLEYHCPEKKNLTLVENQLEGKSANELLGVFETVDEAIQAAILAQKELVGNFTLQDRDKFIWETRKVFIKNAKEIARREVEETKLGIYEDKVVKIKVAAQQTGGTEALERKAFSSHDGLTIDEGAPYGVIGAITPVTNPIMTILSNGISMIASGNAVVFNVHPSAKKICAYGVDLFNKAIIKGGGPANLITMVKEPTLDTVQEIAESPFTRLLVGTGGPGLVKMLLRSGKKVIAAGAGNPPVIVDETADIVAAGATIVKSSSFDNNILCIGEKEVFVVNSVADQLIDVMRSNGAYYLSREEEKKVTELVLTVDELSDNGKEYHIKKEWVGQSASKILSAMDVSVKTKIKNLIFETDFNNPFVQLEQMMPILPIVRCVSFEEALYYAVEAEHDNKHSAAIWSTNTERVTAFGKKINSTIFVQNGSTMAGIGIGGSGTMTATIATPTGEGITNAATFTRKRRFVMAGGGNYIL